MAKHEYSTGSGRNFIDGRLYDFTHARLGEHYIAYGVCAHCHHIYKHHNGDHCLFSPTTFKAVIQDTQEAP